MSIEKNQLTDPVKIMCKDCNTFFGCEAFKGYCSSCFKKNQPSMKNQRKESTQTDVSTSQYKLESPKQVKLLEQKPQITLKKQQIDKKRCFACSKKVGLLGIECKCTFVFCNGHRLPQNHECEFNHRQKGKKKLESQMIKVEFQKIQEI